MDILRSVWIDETCIICNCCETVAPAVFAVDGAFAVIIGDARVDGITSMNAEQVPLSSAVAEHHDAIIEAAAGCPVEAIHLVMIAA